MARTPVSNSDWTSWGTTTVDQAFQAEGGDVSVVNGSTTGLTKDDAPKFVDGQVFIIPAGLAVSFWAHKSGVVVKDTVWGS